MTKALISVRNLDETRMVVDLPIGVLDLKEPADGALGWVGADTAADIARLVRERRADLPVSATTGDLTADQCAELLDRIHALDATGVDYIKIGFFSSDDVARIPPHLTKIRARAKLIAVLFADRLRDFAGPCRLLKLAGFAGVMLDTADKRAGSIVNLLPLQQMKSFAQQARALQLLSGIAGSLSDGDVPELLTCGVNYLGFRSACCPQHRDTSIAPEKVRALLELFDSTACDDAALGVA